MPFALTFYRRTNRLCRVLAAGLGVGPALLWPILSDADTGFRALDEAAIPVKAPSRIFLAGVTRAGGRLITVGEHGVIICSDNNGVTWKQAAIPVSADLTSVRFSSPSCGWAAGHYGVILHRQDAGVTWTIQLTGIQADPLTLAAANAAVAANDPAIGTPISQNRVAFHRRWAR